MDSSRPYNQALRTSFNGVLFNRYKNGEKYVSAHSDEESALDKTHRLVTGIAYGPGVRKFRIRDKKTKEIVLDFEHKSCCLYVMQGNFQEEFTHEIPVQKKVKGERISLTFRHHYDFIRPSEITSILWNFRIASVNICKQI